MARLALGSLAVALVFILAVACTQPAATQGRTPRGSAGPEDATELRAQLQEAEEALRRNERTMLVLESRIHELTEVNGSLVRRQEELNKRLKDQLSTRPRDETIRKPEAQLKNAVFWLNKYREKYGDIGSFQGTPGVVRALRGNLVSISVGSDDGVRTGDPYQIRRGSTYVGQITITSVQKDLSIGKFDEEFKGPGAPAVAGDKAEPGGY